MIKANLIDIRQHISVQTQCPPFVDTLCEAGPYHIFHESIVHVAIIP